MFHWSFIDVLNMPAVTFFSMLTAGRKVHARRMMELCDISAISLGNHEFYKKVREQYSGAFLDREAIYREVERKTIPVHIDQTTESGKFSIMGLFAQARRLNGLG